MMKKIFDAEGPFFGFLDKFGQIILLSVLWLIGCIPVVTITTANSALYYAVVKCVRRGQGNAVKEFLRCYRRNLLPGMGMTVIFLAGFAALEALSVWMTGMLFPTGAAFAMMLLLAFAWCYLGSALSRFGIGVVKIIKLSFVMSLQYAHYTLVFLIGGMILIIGQFILFPMAMILVLPGAWCWLTSFLMEKVLLRYMPPKTEEDDNWYYEK